MTTPPDFCEGHQNLDLSGGSAIASSFDNCFTWYCNACGKRIREAKATPPDRPSRMAPMTCLYCGRNDGGCALCLRERLAEARAEVAALKGGGTTSLYWQNVLIRAEKAEAEVARLEAIIDNETVPVDQYDETVKRLEAEVERLKADAINAQRVSSAALKTFQIVNRRSAMAMAPEYLKREAAAARANEHSVEEMNANLTDENLRLEAEVERLREAHKAQAKFGGRLIQRVDGLAATLREIGADHACVDPDGYHDDCTTCTKAREALEKWGSP